MRSYGRKNPLPFSFSKRSPVSGLRQTRKQRETGVKRVETVGVYPLAHRRGYGVVPAAGRGTFPPSADGESPAEVQRKTLRPLGTNTLTQFVHPAGSVQIKQKIAALRRFSEKASA